MDGTIRILSGIKDKGYKAYYLSDFHEAAFARVRETNGFFDRFEGGVVSYRVNPIKPDHAIYHRLALDCGITPEESLFVDDIRENIRAARETGYHAYPFRTPGDLRMELMEQGIL